MSTSLPPTTPAGAQGESPNPEENGRPLANRVSWEETVRRWSTTCSLCRQPCASEDAKQLALGHVMHQACYDEWLESQDDGARLEAKIRNFAAEEETRRRVRKWMTGEQ